MSLSQSSGRYISAIALGDVTLSALDLEKSDTVSVQGTTSTSRQVLPLDLALAARPPTVGSVTVTQGIKAVDLVRTPTDNGNVALGDPIVIAFLEPNRSFHRDSASRSARVDRRPRHRAAGADVQRHCRDLPPRGGAAAEYGLHADLEPGHQGPVRTVAAGGLCRDVYEPRHDRAAAAPGGQYLRDDSRRGRQDHDHRDAGHRGRARHGDGEELTKKTVTPVVLDANGGFVVIVQAAANDRLQLTLRDAGGNETVVVVPRFRRENTDGSVSEAIGAQGGRVSAPGGVSVDVPAGAFPLGTIVTLKAITEAHFPVSLTTGQRAFLQYSGGIELDLGGKTSIGELKISIAAAAGDTDDNDWIVGRVIGGVTPSLEMIDTAGLTEGRVTTMSPPCPGVTGSGVYGFIKSGRPIDELTAPWFPPSGRSSPKSRSSG